MVLSMLYVAAAVTFLVTLIKPFRGQEIEAPKVKLATYYETLCPDSVAFIRFQLWPTFQDIGSIIDLELVPYGKAAYEEHDNGSVSFRCHHGARECQGNTVQSCALEVLNDINRSLPFINCMESKRQPETAGPRCARAHGINYTTIRQCVNGPQGQQLLLANGKKTAALNPRLNFVPWITIDSNHTEDIQFKALRNLFRLVCDSYTGTKPSKCVPYEPSTTDQPDEPDQPTGPE